MRRGEWEREREGIESGWEERAKWGGKGGGREREEIKLY